MDRQVRHMFAQSAFFFVVGVVLASLFMWSMMQGIAIHLNGRGTDAFVYYFIGWVSGVGGISLYWQAKYIFHMAKISG